jgi:hypothetical protein
LDDAWYAYYTYFQGKDQSLDEYMKEYRSLVQVLDHYGATIGSSGPHIASVKSAVIADWTSDTTIPSDVLEKRAIAAARLKVIAIGFMKRADKKRYGALWSDLENQFTRGVDQYPKDLVGAYAMLLNYKPPPVQHNQPRRDREQDDDVTGLSFLQSAQLIPGDDGETHNGIKCFGCNKYGHFANHCPDNEPSGAVQLLQIADGEAPYQSNFSFLHVGDANAAFVLAQAGRGIIPPTWILLDSQSTASVFNNRALLTNIRKSPRSLKVYTNGGTQITTELGSVRNFGDVWYNPESLANILSMAEVRKVCRITMDTSIEACMNVHRRDGSVMKFQEYRSGLYYFDSAAAAEGVKDTTSPTVTDYLFLNTVASNKDAFTQREIQGADRARDLYRKIGRPSQAQFTTILEKAQIRNCPVTPDDARRALKIYGPDVATLQGKTVKKQNRGIPNYQAATIPAPIIAQYRDIRLFIDIFWVNGSPYFHTISEWIKFRTVAAINNRTKRTLHQETQAVIRLYEARGFTVSRVEGDREFACIENELLPTPLNVADADDHVAEVERSIRTIKERVRCLVQGLPFKRIPKKMMRAAIENANKTLNQFPAQNGVSDDLSPLTIMTGRPTPDYNDLKIEFGAYAQVFEESERTNTLRTRTTGAIALTPTGNAQGGYYFLSLATGMKLSRQQWDELPMPDGIIETVENMAEEEGQPLVALGAPFFEWSPGVTIADDEPPPVLQPEYIEILGEGHELEYYDIAGDYEANEAEREAEDNEPLFGQEPHHHDEEEIEENMDAEELAMEPMEPFEQVNEVGYVGEQRSEQSDDSDDDEQQSNDKIEDHDEQQPLEEETLDEANQDSAAVDDDQRSEAQIRHNLRPNRAPNYSNRLDHVMDKPANTKSYDAQFLQHGDDDTVPPLMPRPVYPPDSDKFADGDAPDTLREAVQHMQRTGTKDSKDGVLKCITGIMMLQMSAKAGIKKHGQAAIDALFQEFAQLHDLGVFLAQDSTKLTVSEKKGALRAITVIKEKRCGKIKGRTVADGRPQRSMYTKEETSSPTVSTDALMMSLLIDAKERRDVATADVAGAYLHADMDDFTLLKMEGESVDIMCDVSPEYKKFVVYEHGKKVLYLKLLKALYGCVKSALLWYDLFTGTLQDMGYELNPYDACVANKMVDGKQCTICWYVDDNKISHVDDKVVTDVIDKIETRFGKMTVTRGKEHVFLGMHIKFHDDGTVSIKMKDYIKEAIADFGEDITRSAATPATRKLFEIDETSEVLSVGDSEIFHSVTAKLLYVSKRSRLDIQLAIAFLCTRVSCSTDKDWLKLKRVLEYLRGTLDEYLTLGADDLSIMKTWVDASYAVHHDMKSHTGGVISFGIGAVMSKCSKHKLNTKSSTEAELVGASDYLPYPIWAKKFLAAQGYALRENIFYQDNQSTIRFEKNGRRSCGPNSRHIDIRYFFIKDRLELEDIEVQYCPTEQMLADFFTKPLQGGLFRKFRAVIMGHKHIDSLKDPKPIPSQERVEEDSKKEIVRNGLDGRKTDVSTQEPVKASYADIVKRISFRSPLESER